MPINLSGSLVLTGSITTTGGITISGSIASASFAGDTALFAGNPVTVFPTTGSNTFVGSQTITGSVLQSGSLSVNGCIVSTGQIVAQTINVQQVTSSIVYSCGSNIFGSAIGNTQVFTGSFYQTGSVAVFNSSVGVGTTNPGYQLEIVNPSSDPSAGLFRCSNGVGVGIGRFYSSGLDSANTKIIYSYFQTAIEACGTTSYCSRFEIFGACNGALTRGFMLNGVGVGCFASTVCSPSIVGGTISGTTGTFSSLVTINTNDALRIDPSTGASYLQFRIGGTPYSYIGVAGLANDLIAGSALGDLNIRAGNNQKILFSTNNGGSCALTISSTGVASFACQICTKSLWFLSNSTGQITFGSNDTCNPYVVSDASNNLYIGSNNGYKILIPQDGSDMVFRTSATYGNPQTRLTITSTGNIGINTPSPCVLLDANSATGVIISATTKTNDVCCSEIRAGWVGGTYMRMGYHPSSAVSYIDNTYPVTTGQVYGDIQFRHNVSGTMTNRMVLKGDSGNVYVPNTVTIGTTCAAFGRALTAYSDVVAYFSSQESITMGISSGTGAQSWGIQVCDTGDGGSALHLNARGGNVGINIGAGNAASYPLHVNGTAYATGAAGALSDCRRKQCIQSLSKGLSEVMRLNPVEFEWKNQYINDCGMTGTQLGFIAQEVREILPSSILVDSLNDDTLALKINEFIPILTKAIQEQQCTINTLKTCLGII